jgi:dihydrofolate synthase/folylpolyglutamate synthase
VIKTIAQSKQSEYFISDNVLSSTIQDDSCTISQKLSDNLSDESLEKTDDFDVENSRIAKAAVHLLRKAKVNNKDIFVSDQHIREGTSIRPPCRFETFQIKTLHQGNEVTVVLDIAHNPPALKVLISKLKKTFPDKEFRFVIGISSDKDIKEFGNILLSEGLNSNKKSDQIHLVEAASNHKAATVEKVLRACPALCDVINKSDGADKSVHAEVQSALTIASLRGEVIVICGTVFIMSDVRQALGLNEPRDSKYITSAFELN